MANYKTGAQRYNDRMDKIFDRAKAEGRGLVGNSKTKGSGVNSKAMSDARNKAIHAKKEGKKKVDRSPIKLGVGSLKERRYQADRANADMRRRGTFYTAANKRAGLF